MRLFLDASAFVALVEHGEREHLWRLADAFESGAVTPVSSALELREAIQCELDRSPGRIPGFAQACHMLAGPLLGVGDEEVRIAMGVPRGSSAWRLLVATCRSHGVEHVLSSRSAPGAEDAGITVIDPHDAAGVLALLPSGTAARS